MSKSLGKKKPTAGPAAEVTPATAERPAETAAPAAPKRTLGSKRPAEASRPAEAVTSAAPKRALGSKRPAEAAPPAEAKRPSKRLGVHRAEDKVTSTATAAASMSFSYVVNGKTVALRLPNETYSTINVQDPHEYDSVAHRLIAAARAVRRQDLFGNVNIRALAATYPFVPYAYQIQNVNTMLNRFEGRGVFGDQVGLGKTVEALMTAHAMFESGAIRNALVVVPPKTMAGWKSEVTHKFPGIFEIVEIAQENVVMGDRARDEFLSTLAQIAADNAAESREGARAAKRRLYFISSDLLRGSAAKAMRSYLSEQLYYRILERPLTEKEKGAFDKIHEISLVSIERTADPRGELLRRLEPFAERESFLLSRDVFPYEVLPIRVVEGVIAALRRLEEKCGSSTNRSVLSLKKAVADQLVIFEGKLERKKNISRANSLLRDLFGRGDGRLVDLLIVDEIHSFYEQEEAIGESAKRDSQRFSLVDLLADIKKKFCLLISATPVRTCLRDVYDLIRIADERLLGEGGDRERYFYSTICQLTDLDSPYMLRDMMDSDELRRNFFGLINNFFTRRRIDEVEEDMLGVPDDFYTKDLDDAEEQARRILQRKLFDALEAPILAERALMLLQSNKSERERREGPARDLAYFKTGFAEWRDDPALLPYRRRHIRAAVDSAMINAIRAVELIRLAPAEAGESDLSALLAEQFPRAAIDGTLILALCRLIAEHEGLPVCRSLSSVKSDSRVSTRLLQELHMMVNWSRRGKEGICILPEESRKLHVGHPIFDNAYSVYSRLEGNENGAHVDVYNRPPASSPWEKRRDRDQEEAGLAHRASLDVLEYAHALGPTLYYVSRTRLSPRNGMLDVCSELATLLHGYRGTFADGTVHEKRACTALESADCTVPKVTRANPNQLLLMGSDFQAGVNLQQYRTLVLYQMDVAGERLLDPVDIEQWIGRIHRTGQTQNCRIVTVLTAYMKFNQKKDVGFLKWYYRLLSDPQGLDLFGNGTPDIAFLQPVIVDLARKMLRTDISEELSAAEREEIRRQNAKLDKLRFAELMERIYFGRDGESVGETEGRRQEIIANISDLCGIEGFGKPKRA